MKRRIFIVFVCLLAFAMMFTGCTSKIEVAEEGTEDSTTEEETTEDNITEDNINEGGEEITLRYTAFTSDDQSIIDSIIEAFEAENPGVTINYEKINDTALYYTNLQADITSGTQVDIFDFHPNSVFVSYIREGYIADLSDLAFNDVYMQAGKDITELDGKNYGYLNNINMIVCYYNKNIFSELGLTQPNNFDELVSTVNTLKENGYGGIGYFGATVSGAWLAQNMMLAELGSKGYYDYWTAIDSGELTNIADNDGAYQAIKSLEAIYQNDLLYENSNTIAYDQNNALFATKNAAIIMQGTWEFANADTCFPGVDFGIFPFPSLNEADIAYGSPGQVTCVNANGENVEMAKKFVDFLAKVENAQYYANAVKTLCPIEGVVVDYTGADILQEQLERGMEALPVMDQADVDAWSNILQSMYADILFNGVDADTAIAKAEQLLLNADLGN